MRVVSYDQAEHLSRCFMPAAAGGLIDARWCTAHYADIIAALPADLGPAEVERDDLLLYRDRAIRIYLTPFDDANREARITLVGLTPGRHQMHLALTSARAALREGCSVEDTIARAKTRAAFEGQMRENLIKMLDGIGLQSVLGLESSRSLFGDHARLVSSTSAICHATFANNGDNYRGAPSVARHPVLRAFAQQVLTANLARTPDALIIPFGKAAREALTLAEVDPRRVLLGFPHPSGGNGHRKHQYDLAQERLSKDVVNWFGRCSA